MREHSAASCETLQQSRKPIGRTWFEAWTGLVAGLERWRQRRRLLQLDERMLHDIGISRCDAEREAAKRWR